MLGLPGQREDDLSALSNALDVEEPSSAIVPRPAVRPIVHGNEDEVLDLSALAKLSAPAASPHASSPPRFSQPARMQLELDEEPVVPPQRKRPTWLMPLLIGLGCGAAFSAIFFAGSRGGDRPAVAPAAPGTAIAAKPAAAAPPVAAQPIVAPPVAEPAAAYAPQPSPDEAGAAVAPPPSAAQLPVAAPAAAGTAQVGPDTAEHAVVERSALPAVASARTPAGTRAGVLAASEAEQPAPSPAATPSAGPAAPVLVVRRADPPAAAPQPVAAPSPGAPGSRAAAARSSGGSLDSLLDDALSPEARRAEAARTQAPSSTQPLPLTPSREEVAAAVGKVQFAIRGCAMGRTGSATAALSVGNDGRVSSAQIIGAPFAGTAAGRCMEGVLRSAHFPRFKQPTLSVRYPLSIQ